MSEAAQAGALLHHRGGAVRIDLDHEALAEPLVAVVVAAVDAGTGLAGVPALVLVGRTGRFPLVAAVGSGGGGDVAPVAHKRCIDLGRALGLIASGAEVVTRPVLFSGQQRAPQRLAVAAVVERDPPLTRSLLLFTLVIGLLLLLLLARALGLETGASLCTCETRVV